MKTVISVVTTMVLILAFGSAFADEMPGTKALESGAYTGFAVSEHEMPATGASPGGKRDEGFERSTIIWESLFGTSKTSDLPDPYGGFLKHETAAGVKSAAPGGVRADEDRGGEIFDSLLGRRGESNIAY